MSPLKDKIEQTINEVRVVLPGAQALLGFQFAAAFAEGFHRLPENFQLIHLASLFSVALATIFLITPAAYHRIVDGGQLTDHFHEVASRLIVAALVPLGFGVSLDFFVVAYAIHHDLRLAAVLGLIMAIISYGFWFGLTLYQKRQK